MARTSTPVDLPHVFLQRTPESAHDARIVRRIRLVSGLLGGGFLVASGVSLVLAGELLDEFANPWQWIPSTFIVLGSLAVFILASANRLPRRAILNSGVLYEIAMSFAIAGAQYFGAFEDITVQQMERDLIGVSWVGMWMLLYTVLVPARPRVALTALTLSGSAVPTVYLASVAGGSAPALPAVDFFVIFVLPYVVLVAASYAMARIVHRLGQEARQALELGSYRLQDLIGRGGMGEVWRASHRMLVRPAAVKLIRPDALAGGEQAYARFEREAQVTASLQSPHTVELYDFGRADDGTLYYVMELLDGINLESVVERFGPLPAERVIHVLGQTCASLGEAHRHEMVHRDIKPGNILLCRRAFGYDFVKVLDFGLVKRHATGPDADDMKLTKANSVAGTPSFMSPEMIMGDEAVDGRADLYAVGCVAYWLLTGTLVFPAATVPAMMVAHANKAPEPPSSRTEQPIPQMLDDLILQCLAKSPAERPASAEGLAHQLRAIPVDSAWTAERAAEWWARHLPGGAAVRTA